MSTAPRFVTKPETKPRVHLLPDGSGACIRLIQSADQETLVSFHRHLSDKTVYLRYFSPVSLAWRTSAKRLADDLCDDPAHHLTFVIERRAAGSGLRSLIGIGRLVMSDTHTSAEFAMTIRDDFQGMGLGAALLDVLVEAGRAESLHAITASVLPENRRMLELCKARGFRVVTPGTGGPVEVVLDLVR